MSDMLDKVEIAIGKLLDGELSPPERSLLETELQRDPHARELYEQMRVLHECSCGVVTHEVLGRGADPADIFERAWQQNKRSFWRRIAGKVGVLNAEFRVGGASTNREGARWGGEADTHLHRGFPTRRTTLGIPRFAAGVAAGFLLGLVLRFGPLSSSNTPSNLPLKPPVAWNVPSGTDGRIGMGSQTPDTPFGNPITPVRQVVGPRQYVDWYVYTDRAGNQWLIEGTREGVVKPAAYGRPL
jgi:hypothetical protein